MRTELILEIICAAPQNGEKISMREKKRKYPLKPRSLGSCLRLANERKFCRFAYQLRQR